MAYRNLMIASNAQLKIKNEQLLITTDTTHKAGRCSLPDRAGTP